MNFSPNSELETISTDQPNSLQDLDQAYDSSVEVKKKKKKINRCSFEVMPRIANYQLPSTIYQICGDIFMMKYKENLVSEVSFINEFKICSKINLKEQFDQRILSVELTDRHENSKFATNELLECLDPLDVSQSKWLSLTKNFMSVFSKVIMKQSRRKPKTDVRKKFYTKVTQITVDKIAKLFDKFPCIRLKYRLRYHKIQITEICFSERFVNELSYDIEEFISLLLAEGIPQLMCYKGQDNIEALWSLLENYFKIEDEGSKMKDLSSKLLLKHGFVKNILYQRHTLMNYDTNTFGFDVILSLTHKGEAYIENQVGQLNDVNTDFIEKKILEEINRNNFLSAYDVSPKRDWLDFQKTCLVKQLESEDDDNLEEIADKKVKIELKAEHEG